MTIQLPKLQPTLLKSLPYEAQEWFRQLQALVVAAGGTVTSVSVTTNAGVSGSVATPTSTAAITITLGNITPSSVVSGAQVQATTSIIPGTPAGATQTACHLFAGTGAPSNADGIDGDIYFRSNGGAGTTIYHRRAGAWVGIV